MEITTPFSMSQLGALNAATVDRFIPKPALKGNEEAELLQHHRNRFGEIMRCAPSIDWKILIMKWTTDNHPSRSYIPMIETWEEFFDLLIRNARGAKIEGSSTCFLELVTKSVNVDTPQNHLERANTQFERCLSATPSSYEFKSVIEKHKNESGESKMFTLEDAEVILRPVHKGRFFNDYVSSLATDASLRDYKDGKVIEQPAWKIAAWINTNQIKKRETQGDDWGIRLCLSEKPDQNCAKLNKPNETKNSRDPSTPNPPKIKKEKKKFLKEKKVGHQTTQPQAQATPKQKRKREQDSKGSQPSTPYNNNNNNKNKSNKKSRSSYSVVESSLAVSDSQLTKGENLPNAAKSDQFPLTGTNDTINQDSLSSADSDMELDGIKQREKAKSSSIGDMSPDKPEIDSVPLPGGGNRVTITSNH